MPLYAAIRFSKVRKKLYVIALAGLRQRKRQVQDFAAEKGMGLFSAASS